MVTRLATADDAPGLLLMGQQFLASDDYRHEATADVRRMETTLRSLLASDMAAVFVAEINGEMAGMFGVIAYQHPFSSDSVASELFWWVVPAWRGTRVGLKLFATAEAWARNKGATVFQMIAPNERVAALYSRRGYHAVEESWHRRIA